MKQSLHASKFTSKSASISENSFTNISPDLKILVHGVIFNAKNMPLKLHENSDIVFEISLLQVCQRCRILFFEKTLFKVFAYIRIILKEQCH